MKGAFAVPDESILMTGPVVPAAPVVPAVPLPAAPPAPAAPAPPPEPPPCPVRFPRRWNVSGPPQATKPAELTAAQTRNASVVRGLITLVLLLKGSSATAVGVPSPYAPPPFYWVKRPRGRV